MSWEEELFALFDELEEQASALYDADRGAELADRSRAEYRHITLASRLVASLDQEIVLDVEGFGPLRGTLRRANDEWCLLRGATQDWAVPLEAVTSVTGGSDRSVPEVAWSAVSRLGFASALRRVAEAGERCMVHLRDGSRHDLVLHRVGADFVEGLPGERGAVLLAFASIAAVQSRE